jgi:CO/xanthine dehydrogenase Mo-binding subunit
MALLQRRGALHTPEFRAEGRDKVTGRAEYAADITMPKTLWAAFAESPLAHARIVAIDTAAARAVPGVHAVLTAADIGRRYLGRALMDWPVLACDKVLFIGQHVAAVAADTPEIAAAAVREIDVRYEELPAVFAPAAALAPDAPVLHEHPERYTFLHGARAAVAHPNLQGHVVSQIGDVEGTLRNAERTFEHRFHTPSHHAGYIEPHACTVWIDSAGVIHVVTTNKSPFQLRRQIATSIGVSEETVVVEAPFIGGDFGGKGLSVDEYPCYYLAFATGRPVKHVRRHVDDVQATNVRHAADIVIRSGVATNGRLRAMDIRVTYNGGAFAAGKPLATLVPGHTLQVPYHLEHGRIESTAVYTNTVPTGHLRAPADVQLAFALESHMDMIAHDLCIDPLEFRARNAMRDGDRDFSGALARSPQVAAVLDKIREAHGSAPLRPGHGRGVSLTARHIGPGVAHVVLRLFGDGRLEALTGVTDQGAGAASVIARTIAEVLGIGEKRVRVTRGDTATAMFDLGPGASRITHIAGNAAVRAAELLRKRLYDAGWDGDEASWERTAEAAVLGGALLEMEGVFDTGEHGGDAQWLNVSGYSIEVKVDRDTGAVHVVDALYVADVGTIVNPIAHQGQIDGGFVFGLGHALTEEVLLDEGKIVNLSLADYKLPTQRDCPPLRTMLLPAPFGPGPFGAKAAGEISTAGVAPAIANAIFAACGARMSTMPMTGERVYSALAGTTIARGSADVALREADRDTGE